MDKLSKDYYQHFINFMETRGYIEMKLGSGKTKTSVLFPKKKRNKLDFGILTSMFTGKPCRVGILKEVYEDFKADRTPSLSEPIETEKYTIKADGFVYKHSW